MIKAIIFDLDGTLVQTEVLKAESYAKAAVELDPTLSQQDVVEGFKEFVGLSRKEVAKGLLNKFNLGDAASKRMDEFDVAKPWQAFVDIRMDAYFKMISDPKILKEHLCPYNLALLKWSRDEGYTTALGTMSHRREAYRVLDVLDIRSEFDVISTIQDVEHGKPDPEIYNLMLEELRISSNEGLAVEDSSSGIRAALAARVSCIAVPSDFTRVGVHKLPQNDHLLVVDNLAELLETTKNFISEINSDKEAAN